MLYHAMIEGCCGFLIACKITRFNILTIREPDLDWDPITAHETTVDPWKTFRYDAIIQANRTR
jgi:hypothetical protein